MNDLSIFLLTTVAATFFAAGTVKGVTGMGLPTVAMGILGGLLSPIAAASLLIIPSFRDERLATACLPELQGHPATALDHDDSDLRRDTGQYVYVDRR
jgi:hypothetical protein